MVLSPILRSHCYFKRSFSHVVACPILKFSSNLKPQARTTYNKSQLSMFLNNKPLWKSQTLNVSYKNENKLFIPFNLYINNHRSNLQRLFHCHLFTSCNTSLINYYDNSCKTSHRSTDYGLVNWSNYLKTGYNYRSFRNYSQKKTIISHKHFAIKRHELIKGVLREKQRKIRQTQLKLKRSGRLLLDDIKETKSKMKVKMEEIIERENIWTIPNMLCIARIVISPYLGYVILDSNYNLALGLVIFAGITDLLDGVIARTFKSQSSKLGSFLDPMADKVLIASLFLSLTASGNMPIPLTALIVTRDILLATAGSYIRYQSLPPPRTISRYFDMTHATAQLTPTMISKINTMVQLVTVFSTLTAVVFEYTHHPALYGLWYLTAGTTIASAISYLTAKNTYKILKKKNR